VTYLVEEQLGAAVHQSSALSRTGMLERLFSRLFHGLVYPQIWEDPVVDMAVLNIGPRDHLVCIASGGCNVMSYLTAGPAAITAVDLSPAHVALGRLKLAAARHLPDDAAFFDFFGRADLAANVTAYDRHIARHLDPETRAFWEDRVLGRRRITMFQRDFYRFGLLGRFLGAVHLVARLGRVDFGELLAAPTLADQQRFFDARVAPLFEMSLVRYLARRRASLFGLGIPPAQYDKLAADGGGDVIPVLRERVRKLICDFPIAKNYFAWQAFHRGYAEGANPSVPPYLESRNFAALRAHAGRVEVVNRSLTDLLAETPAASRDCYVLLDAQDWMNDDQLNTLWQQIDRTAAPGARVIFRTGGAADILPGRVAPEVLSGWQYDAAASAIGFANDRSAIYGGFHFYRRREASDV
jgi:S-adenosylmethionine-diacylglycerol 3-amino-3-carboxypropyl transferase